MKAKRNQSQLALERINNRLRRLEMALKFRKQRYEITPTPHFFQAFPGLKGRKFWLVKWVDDFRIKVLVSGKKNAEYYAHTFFKL